MYLININIDDVLCFHVYIKSFFFCDEVVLHGFLGTVLFLMILFLYGMGDLVDDSFYLIMMSDVWRGKIGWNLALEIWPLKLGF
jgi:hypothetical protein